MRRFRYLILSISVAACFVQSSVGLAKERAISFSSRTYSVHICAKSSTDAWEIVDRLYASRERLNRRRAEKIMSEALAEGKLLTLGEVENLLSEQRHFIETNPDTSSATVENVRRRQELLKRRMTAYPEGLGGDKYIFGALVLDTTYTSHANDIARSSDEFLLLCEPNGVYRYLEFTLDGRGQVTNIYENDM